MHSTSNPSPIQFIIRLPKLSGVSALTVKTSDLESSTNRPSRTPDIGISTYHGLGVESNEAVVTASGVGSAGEPRLGRGVVRPGRTLLWARSMGS